MTRKRVAGVAQAFPQPGRNLMSQGGPREAGEGAVKGLTTSLILFLLFLFSNGSCLMTLLIEREKEKEKEREREREKEYKDG